jgi:hypothetical protein
MLLVPTLLAQVGEGKTGGNRPSSWYVYKDDVETSCVYLKTRGANSKSLTSIIAEPISHACCAACLPTSQLCIVDEMTR